MAPALVQLPILDALAGGAVSRRDRLRRATDPAHRALERRVEAAGFLDGVAGHARHLAAALPLYAALEARLEAAGTGALLPDWPRRRKAGLIREDLLALGVAPPEGAAEPEGPLARRWGRGTALGVLYVLEGATLGGAVLARRMARFGLAPGRGASFLDPYGAGRGAMWRDFLAALEAAPLAPEEDAALEPAATAAFTLFAAQLGGHAA